jgi:hypothetical protein
MKAYTFNPEAPVALCEHCVEIVNTRIKKSPNGRCTFFAADGRIRIRFDGLCQRCGERIPDDNISRTESTP